MLMTGTTAFCDCAACVAWGDVPYRPETTAVAATIGGSKFWPDEESFRRALDEMRREHPK